MCASGLLKAAPRNMGRATGQCERIRVPGAMQRSSRCFAEPGSYRTPAFGTAPTLQRTASKSYALRCVRGTENSAAAASIAGRETHQCGQNRWFTGLFGMARRLLTNLPVEL